MNNRPVLPRFFAPDLDPASAQITLPADEARHLTRVLRLSAGDDVAVFDGRGHEFHARVIGAARDRVELDVVRALTPAPEPRVAVTLVQAVLKGDKMDAVVRDATMMGAAAIEPVITARTIGRLRALESGRASERWRRVAISSAKQCRRATLPSIGPGRTLDDWLAHRSESLTLILVEPVAESADAQSLHSLDTAQPAAAVALLVGPEGGWTEEELRDAKSAGCVPVTLGAITLRADAIALAAIAVVRFALRDL
jgi:16S rRNA (uracil1498-N3)-methyltransferase